MKLLFQIYKGLIHYYFRPEYVCVGLQNGQLVVFEADDIVNVRNIICVLMITYFSMALVLACGRQPRTVITALS